MGKITTVLHLLVAVWGMATLSGCSSTGTVVLRTTPPDASVYFFDMKNGSSALIGKSPLTFDKSLAQGSDTMQLRIEKEGFESKFTTVAVFGRETTYVDVKLTSPLETSGEVRKAFQVNRQLMAEATRLSANRRYSEALVRVEKILETDPKNDEAYAAKGSILYLMKDYDAAEVAWKKSLELNPGNDLVRGSLVDLNLRDQPIRKPATEGGQ